MNAWFLWYTCVGKCTIWKHGSYMGKKAEPPTGLLSDPHGRRKGSTAIFVAQQRSECRSTFELQCNRIFSTVWSTISWIFFHFCGWLFKRGGKTPRKTPIHGWHPEVKDNALWRDRAIFVSRNFMIFVIVQTCLSYYKKGWLKINRSLRLITNPNFMHYLQGKTLKMTVDFHCLAPPYGLSIMIPESSNSWKSNEELPGALLSADRMTGFGRHGWQSNEWKMVSDMPCQAT